MYIQNTKSVMYLKTSGVLKKVFVSFNINLKIAMPIKHLYVNVL